MKKEFLIDRQGKTFVLYAGLLDLAHEQGLKEITTHIVQVPQASNDFTAVVTATVVTERGTFTEMGDADRSNVSRMMLPHLLRMASTRAKARALRDATNIGVAALEELGNDGSDEGLAGAEEMRGAARRQDSAPRTGSGGKTEPATQDARPAANAPARTKTPEEMAAAAAQYLAQHSDEAAKAGYQVAALPQSATPHQVIAEARAMRAHIEQQNRRETRP